jgi:hypothetical protein
MLDSLKQSYSWRESSNDHISVLTRILIGETLGPKSRLALIKNLYGSPWMNFSTINIAGAACTILTVSHGTNVPDLVDEISIYLLYSCGDHLIWTGETWT